MSNEITMKITIPADEDGFVLLQCEHCGSYFKVTPSDMEDDEVLFIHCPSCGLISDNYFTDDVIELARTMAKNKAEDLIYNMFKDLERHNSKKSFVRFKVGKKPQEEYESPVKPVTDSLTVKAYSCCNRSAKINPLIKMSANYCPFCGVIDLENG